MMRAMKRALPLLFTLVACASAPAPSRAPAPAPALASAAAPAPAPAPEPAPAPADPPWGNTANLSTFIDTYVGAMGQKWGAAYAFRGIVAVAKDGQPLVVRAFGKANDKSGAVADADTRFRIGSVTKQFTAACILQLSEQGKLKLDDTIRKHLPDYPAAQGDRVTIHQLLSHTSGVPSYTDDDALMKARAKPHTPAQVLATFKDKPLKFEPGSRWEYSNSNYFLLGLVVEKLSGQSYEKYLQEHVLAPAGMTRTSTVDAPDAPNTAVGYDDDDSDDEKLRPAEPIDMSIPFAAGALRSTVNDLFKWDRALAGTSVLSEASKAKMFTPVKEDYGYGVGIRTVDGHTIHSHSGGIDGFRSVLTEIVDQGLVIVVLGNGPAGPDAIARSVQWMLLKGERSAPREERQVAPMTDDLRARAKGEYAISAASKADLESKVPKGLLDSIETITLLVEKKVVFLKPKGQSRVRLFSGGGDALFAKVIAVEVTLEGDAGKPARAFTLKQGGLVIRYERKGR